MKQNLLVALVLACALLAVSLFMLKQSADAQHETDANAMADLSNQLTSAQSRIAVGEAAVVSFSNRLDESWSAVVAFSNRLTEAESAAALDAEQITNLNHQAAAGESENQTLRGHLTELTNSMAGLMQQITLTKTNLAEVQNDYSLLENRFRRDVAERLVTERKFRNLSELQAQIESLKELPATEISAQSIYAGLDVEVKSNSFHVISPN